MQPARKATTNAGNRYLGPVSERPVNKVLTEKWFQRHESNMFAVAQSVGLLIVVVGIGCLYKLVIEPNLNSSNSQNSTNEKNIKNLLFRGLRSIGFLLGIYTTYFIVDRICLQRQAKVIKESTLEYKNAVITSKEFKSLLSKFIGGANLLNKDELELKIDDHKLKTSDPKQESLLHEYSVVQLNLKDTLALDNILENEDEKEIIFLLQLTESKRLILTPGSAEMFREYTNSNLSNSDINQDRVKSLVNAGSMVLFNHSELRVGLESLCPRELILEIFKNSKMKEA